MFKFVAIFALLAVASAARPNYGSPYGSQSSHGPSSDDANAEVKTLHSDVRADGYEYGLDISNGIHADSAGDAYGNMHGSYEWTSPEGVHVKVSYVADENGYHPNSDLLPVGPPTPDYILRSLEYIRTHPHKEEHYGH